MDSITQALLGASVQASLLGRWQGRKSLLYGAMLGTLPDLDVLIDFGDAVANTTYHRGFSHSLFVLSVLAVALAWLIRRIRPHPDYSGMRLFLTLWLVLITHVTLDAFTSYGTQLLWPLTSAPIAWSSVFIIDPLYTVWLLGGCVVAWFARERRAAQVALVAALALSSGYLGLSLLAKSAVERHAQAALEPMGLADASRLSVPMPFTTLLWQVLVMTPDGYLVGDRSLVADVGPMRFTHHAFDPAVRAEAARYPATRRLDWFTHGFWKAEERDGRLVVTDLRMGLEPDYTFRYVVAVEDGGQWRETRPASVSWPRSRERVLVPMWERIWEAPAPAGTGVAQ